MISNIVTVVLLVLSFVLLLLNNHTRSKINYQLAQVDSLQNDADSVLRQAEVSYQRTLKIVNYADTLGKKTGILYISRAGYEVGVFTNSKATPFFKEDERGIIVIIAKENTP